MNFKFLVGGFLVSLDHRDNYFFYVVCSQRVCKGLVETSVGEVLLDSWVGNVVTSASEKERFQVFDETRGPILVLIFVFKQFFFVVDLVDLFASFIAIGDWHVQVQDNDVKNFCKVHFLPLVNDLVDVLLLKFHGLRGKFEGLKAILSLYHLKVVHLEDDVHHVQLTIIIISYKTPQLPWLHQKTIFRARE